MDHDAYGDGTAGGDEPDFDLTDEELRAAGSAKWAWAGPRVIPAWIAEMDVRPCPPVQAAVADAVGRGTFGYPPADSATEVPEATAAVLADRFGWGVDPARVVLCGDVMAGVRLVLDVLCDPAPVVVPTPTYPPFLDVVPLTGRRLVPVPCIWGERPALDLEGIRAALAAGARTVLLSAPHNPLGRVWTVQELIQLRDIVLAHGARVISDEIHAFLALPGNRHTPYAAIEGTAEHVTTVLSASKAWNIPGLKCAQILAGNAADLHALRAVPLVANHGLSPLGAIATVAAYRDGGAWLDRLVVALAARRDRFGTLMAERAPHLRWTPMEGTYLAWIDAAGAGGPNAGTAALRAGVAVGRGETFGSGSEHGYQRYARVTLATSEERLERIVDRLAAAWPSPREAAESRG